MFKKGTVLLVFIYISLINGILFMTRFFLPLFLKNNLHFSGADIGLFMATYSIAGLITVIPIGIFSDRINPKKIITVSLLFLAIFHGGFIYFESIWLTMILCLIGGIGYQMFKVTSKTLVLKKFHFKGDSSNIGIFILLSNIFIAISYVGSGYLYEQFSFIIVLITAFIMLFCLSYMARLLPSMQTVDMKVVLYKSDLLRPRVFFLIMVFFLFSLHFGAEFTSLTLFLQENLSLTKYHIGWYLAIESIFLGISSYFFAREINNGIQTKTILYYGLLFSAVGGIGMVIVPNVSGSLFFRVIHGIGDGAIILLTMVGITKLFIPERFGGHTGFIAFSMILGTALSSLVFGPMGSHFGYGWPLLISSIFTGLVFLLVFFYKEIFEY